MKSRMVALAGGVALVAPLAIAATTTAHAEPGHRSPYVLRNGVSAPVYDYDKAIRETVWVDAPDLDGDGRAERIAADIIRPRELAGTARLPIIMDASPYYLSVGRGNEGEFKEYDAQGRPVKFPLFYDNYFVPRGYAVVQVDMAGTGRSTGCTDEGGRSDVESVKAVVEWLAGKGSATDANGKPANASWSSGRTGMIGKSYDGTLANGVAASGAKGLETIVPIAAISSWYDYNRYQNLVKSINYPSGLSASIARNRTIATDCSDRLAWMDANDGDETGRYTDFWAERDYREGTFYDASKVKASVFVVHGLQDTNVKTRNFSTWWDAVGRAGVDRKMMLTRLGHVDPFDSNRRRWVDTLHRWFDHELMSIENGILDEPAVSVETAPGQWAQSDAWPIHSSRTKALRPQRDGTAALGRPGSGTATFTNSPTQREADAVLPGDNPNRLLFTTGATKHRVRVSGTPSVDLDISHAAPTGQVGVYLVDYGEADRVLTTQDGVMNLSTQSCWGAVTARDDGCYTDVARRVGSTPLQVLARGWARLDGAGRHRLTVTLDANDVTVEAGHRLGLVVVGASRGWTVTVDNAATPYTVHLARTQLNLPVSGPMAGFGPGGPRSLDRAPAGTFVTPDPTVIPR